MTIEMTVLRPEALKLLCCPETHQPLRLAGERLLNELNERISRGCLHTRGGQPIIERIEAGLLRADGQVLYPIRQNIPVLLVAEGIALPATGQLTSA